MNLIQFPPPAVFGAQPGPLGLGAKGERFARRLSAAASLSQSLSTLGAEHAEQMRESTSAAGKHAVATLRDIWPQKRGVADLLKDWNEYAADYAQRVVLFLDIMREVGDTFNEQLATEDRPPVLAYEYNIVLDGRHRERPVNYLLLEIIPPQGVTVDPAKRPYMIIDPRAGHGAGIGGFKKESEVGVALAHGHPVYFVIFLPRPVPGQTLADICAAEGAFVREVALRHPAAPKPVVIGNCQGGWATALVAATNPHVTGPIVLNGAPMSYWAGERGKNPLRYMGGLAFGAMPALLASDLGNGRFDGADLVQNFEKMNPGVTKWMKYYSVFANVDSEGPRFKGFEKWWSSFYFMNESEIRWVVENLFIGNKLQRGLAVLGRHGAVDLREIRAPIIVFASKGDDITPPPQALNWIGEVYGDERQIRARGQTILYIVHEEIGHLGIFVSAKVAQKEHDRIVTTLDAVEALPPGLYEMQIEKIDGAGGEPQYVVGFEERTIADLRVYDDGKDDEKAFAVVARMSEAWVDAYEMTIRPLVQAMVTPAFAEARVNAHPLRMRRTLLSSRNPLTLPIAPLAAAARAARKPAAPNNPFLQTEKLAAAMIGQTMDFWRDLKSAVDELAFFSIYASPFLAGLARLETEEPNVGLDATLREEPAVREALHNIAQGGYAEAVLRMLILMARSRGEVRQSRLQRSSEILQNSEPFRSLGDVARARIIHQQTLVVDFEPEQAVSTLAAMLPQIVDRERAIALVEEIAGAVAEMSEPTLRMLAHLRRALDLPPNGALPALATAQAPLAMEEARS
jgi:pimeloyl-ACP methyl ester carboxylesterase/tellurite resistance protein